MPLIGSGPFKFVEAEWVPGSKVVYEKFADYVPRSEAASGASGGRLPDMTVLNGSIFPIRTVL
ncbi:MAG: hypothetical protein CM1200mP39_25000 [Dehalococcoidia bacterium]|nr:MAG: hypothetical protein CM1200mP39_25000 [Dehalococcoidia bacterium]